MTTDLELRREAANAPSHELLLRRFGLDEIVISLLLAGILQQPASDHLYMARARHKSLKGHQYRHYIILDTSIISHLCLLCNTIAFLFALVNLSGSLTAHALPVKYLCACVFLILATELVCPSLKREYVS